MMNTQKKGRHDIGDPGPRLGEAQEGGRIKPVNGIYVKQ